MASDAVALPYHEPDIVTILILASFLLLLNGVNSVLDGLIYCGLIGQIFVGVGWGVPGADLLSLNVQNAVSQLGYLGLILIVFEGGLETNMGALKANLLLSALVALIGISAPIGLSFVLQALMGATPLQAFAAGAALCSTSLGTTFTVLKTSGLAQSRLGVVLTNAAMIDDIVGLIMVQVISNLGGQENSFEASTVIRPIGVSVALAVIVPLLLIALRALVSLVQRKGSTASISNLSSLANSSRGKLVLHSALLIAMVTGSSYAGTSNLFAAYLAGAAIAWCDTWTHAMPQGPPKKKTRSGSAGNSSVGHEASSATSQLPAEHSGLDAPSLGDQHSEQKAMNERNKATSSNTKTSSPEGPTISRKDSQTQNSIADHRMKAPLSGREIYERYYSAAVATILKPFFFASIGFSIPVQRMFDGETVWRGIVYAILMAFGKLLCGLCLVRFQTPSISFIPRSISERLSFKSWRGGCAQTASTVATAAQPEQEASTQRTTQKPPKAPKKTSLSPPKPRSLYPAAILGSAMMARGEIGFLVSAIAQSKGLFGADTQASPLFLVVTWAILLCTIIGPVTVGLLVRRVKRLQELERERRSGKEDPLGVWGIIATPETT